MTGSAIVSEIIATLTSGISGIATGVGQGFSTLAQSIFLQTTGDGESAVTTISVFGTLVVVFAAISLGLALCRWVLNFITSIGNRNR